MSTLINLFGPHVIYFLSIVVVDTDEAWYLYQIKWHRNMTCGLNQWIFQKLKPDKVCLSFSDGQSAQIVYVIVGLYQCLHST